MLSDRRNVLVNIETGVLEELKFEIHAITTWVEFYSTTIFENS